MQPGGTFISIVFFFWRSYLTASVCCARWTSGIQIFLEEPNLNGFLNMLPHSCSVQSFIIFSLHQALSWNVTFTLWSQLSFSFVEILFTLQQNIIVGLTRGAPSAKTVSCTVCCLLSNPDEPTCTPHLLCTTCIIGFTIIKDEWKRSLVHICDVTILVTSPHSLSQKFCMELCYHMFQ